jgi:hypothetical protein
MGQHEQEKVVFSVTGDIPHGLICNGVTDV